MPYRRKTRFKRRRKRFRRTTRRPMTTGRVIRIIDAELKVRDLGVSLQTMPNGSGSVTLISNVGQGDLNTQRDGNWIKPITWMGTITVIANAADKANSTVPYRIGCVVWMENNDINDLTLAKVMQDNFAPHQQFNIENKGQFKVLWSRTGILSTDPTNVRFQVVHKFYLKPRLKILFDAADLKNNHLFIFGYSDVDAIASPPSMRFDTRLRFTDS